MRTLLLSSLLAMLACVGDEAVGSVPKDGAANDAGPGDAGAGDAASDAGATDAQAEGGLPLPTSKLVFLSSAVQNASELKDLGRVCTTDLQRHGRGAGFAWAQDASGKSPTSRLGAYDGPWVLPSGTVVFAHKADITGGAGAAVAINETLERKLVTDGHAWTALDTTGAPQLNKNCDGWDNSQLSAMTPGTSVNTAGPTWASDGTSLSCHSQNYFICFEQ